MSTKLVLAASITALLIGCSSSNSGSHSDGDSSSSSSSNSSSSSSSSSSSTSSSSSSSGSAMEKTVSGLASAPSGSVAQLKQTTLLEFVLNTLISPAAAAVVGLEAISGATVELIRIDNDGNPTGEILATTTTSITGHYTLTLPANVNLAGNLIVRIMGSSGTSLRAQIVEEEVNINPISEFILKKFIAEDTDLSMLSTEAVVKLSGQIEEFDITASGDISTMLDQLEAEVGEFIDSEIDMIETELSSAQLLSGDYRSATIQYSLHDSDEAAHGTFAVDLWTASFSFSGNADGSVDIDFLGEETAYSNLSGSDGGLSTQLYYEVDIDEDTDSFSATYNNEGVLTIAGEFEENIDGDYGWRFPPVNYRLQKVSDRNIFFQMSQEAAVRYGTVDTDDDGMKDAIDPSDRQGDEVFRGLEIFLKQPSAMTNADLNGNFGRVYMGTFIDNSAAIEMEIEQSEISFSGIGTLDVGAAERTSMHRNSTGQVSINSDTVEAEADLSISVAANGDIQSIGGSSADGFVNDTYDFAVFAESDGTNQAESEFSTTLLVKLPSEAPAVAGKRYRVMLINSNFDEQAISFDYSRFDSYFDWSSQTAGSLTINSGTIYKDNLQAQVEIDVATTATLAASTNVAANGKTTITMDDGEGIFNLNGYLNESGSYGVFTTTYREKSANNPDSIGLAILIELEDNIN